MKGTNGVGCENTRSVKPDNTPNVYHEENAANADQDYSRYNETVGELEKFGFGAYRMSISWTRVLSYKKGAGPNDQVHERRVEYFIEKKEKEKRVSIFSNIEPCSMRGRD